MIGAVVGVVFLLALFAFLYYIRYHTPSKGDTKDTKEIVSLSEQDPKPRDIVLATITSPKEVNESAHAILWNGSPGKNYNYLIMEGATEVAKREVTCPNTGLVKIKGVPIEDGKDYDVTVNNTTVNVIFQPPQFILPVKFGGGDDTAIEMDTSVVPTSIEVLSSGIAVPLSRCLIKIDPSDPGLKCDMGGESLTGEITIMAYNGPNAANIYVDIL